MYASMSMKELIIEQAIVEVHVFKGIPEIEQILTSWLCLHWFFPYLDFCNQLKSEWISVSSGLYIYTLEQIQDRYMTCLHI